MAEREALSVLAIPHEGPRVETGPVQFGDDWPGVFIRGDNAMHYAMRLSIALDHGIDADPMGKAILTSLARLLASCDTRAHLKVQPCHADVLLELANREGSGEA